MGTKKQKTASTEPAELRRRAEAEFGQRPDLQDPSRAPMDAQRLFHELQVHQIELEMQNEELRQSRAEAEIGLARYTDLYDFAPVGYFTMKQDGTVSQVNLSGVRLLDIERSKLIGRRFSLFVAEGDRPLFNAFLGNVFESKVKQACEVILNKQENDRRFSLAQP
ncbi:MAG TPA: PAS domain-containing protein, partial [Leptolinea sp.]